MQFILLFPFDIEEREDETGGANWPVTEYMADQSASDSTDQGLNRTTVPTDFSCPLSLL